MTSPAKLSAIKLQRREKIIDAAQVLFTRDGFKATTMEGIAAAVVMSKVTVYSYFSDKDALFKAVAERFLLRLEEAVAKGIATDGTLAERITAGLVAKYQIGFDVLRSSSFSSELVYAGDEMFAELKLRTRENINKILVDAMVEAGLSRKVACDRARILYAATLGIEEIVSDKDRAIADMRILIAAML